MRFKIEINETTRFRFKITLKQIVQSMFGEQKIRNFTIEMEETTTFAEGLKRFLIERELEHAKE